MLTNARMQFDFEQVVLGCGCIVYGVQLTVEKVVYVFHPVKCLWDSIEVCEEHAGVDAEALDQNLLQDEILAHDQSTLEGESKILLDCSLEQLLGI